MIRIPFQYKEEAPANSVDIFKLSHKLTPKDILKIFIQEHLDQPLKSEKLPFPLTET